MDAGESTYERCGDHMMKLGLSALLGFVCCIFSGVAAGIPLQTIGTFCTSFPDQCRKGTESLWAARGVGTDAYYVVEVDPVTGALIVAGAGGGPIAVTISTVATGSSQIVGSVNCSALTGSYATVITPAFDTKILYIFNSCDQTIKISLDGGTTDAFILETSEAVAMDLAADGKHIASGVALRAKHNGVVPTAGTVRMTAIGG